MRDRASNARRRGVRIAVAVLYAATATAGRGAETTDDVARVIGAMIDAGTPADLRGPRYADYRAAVGRAYESAGHQPLWLHDGSPTAAANAAIGALSAAEVRGLSPADYDAAALRAEAARLTSTQGSATELANFDTALTVSLMRFISDSHNGRLDPRRLGFVLDTAPKPLDLAAAVLELSRSEDPDRRLAELQPQLAIYARLITALATVRALAARDDLRAPKLSATLRPGDRDPAVPALRTYLTALADLAPDAPVPADPLVYDGVLADAVRHFQGRHNLDADAVLGPATRRALAVPLSRRAEQIALALERMRWLPERFEQRFLIINIPAFRLLAFEDETRGPSLAMDVIVGSALRRQFTPVLHAEMRYLIFGPFWNVPRGITRREMVPILRRDLAYLQRQHLEIVGAQGLLPPTRQSVEQVAAGRARLRQRPGPDNALGRVKFIFPNRSNVYLHDTPATGLFAARRRDFSHGCIRVADPLALAEFVLAGQEGWDRERIRAAIEKSWDRRVDLATPLPVYLLYSTAIVTQSGELRFFDDLYGHDERLARLLAERSSLRASPR